MDRRLFLAGVGSALAASFAPATNGRAQGAGGTWPTRALKLVIPFPPGNTADIIARALGEQLSPLLGQPVIVENQAGAAGIVATGAVARAEDGHTFLLTTASPLVLNPVVYAKLPYDVGRDFTPIAELGTISVMLVVNPSFPAGDLRGLVAHLKAHPGTLNYASVGPGTFTHLTMERFKQIAGVDITHVPYRGAGAALTDLMGGRVALMFDSFASSNAQVKGGTLKGIAMTSLKRSPFAPDVPTLAESGLSGFEDFEVEVWAGLLGPARMPTERVARLSEAVGAILQSATFKEKLATQSIAVAAPNGPEAFASRIAADRRSWEGVARRAQLVPVN
jgi:tripartite-type tricarboxylate transporter receptor subunit TctC